MLIRLTVAALIACLLIVGARGETLVTLADGRTLLGIQLPAASERDSSTHVILLLPQGIKMTLNRGDIRTTQDKLDDAYILTRLKEVSDAYALALVEDALLHTPDSPAIKDAARAEWLKGAQAAIGRRDPIRARQLYDKVLTFAPSDGAAAEGRAVCEALLRKLEREADGIRQHLAERPGNDLARYDLGQLYERLGDRARAYTEYQRIIDGKIEFNGGPDRIDELRSLIASLIHETPQAVTLAQPRSQVGPWTDRKTDHFLIRFRGGLDVGPIATAVEDSLARDLAAMEPLRPDGFSIPSLKLTIYWHEEEYRRATGEPVAPALSRDPDLIYASEDTPRLIETALPHEIMHLLIHRAVAPLPLWLDEGLAVRQESTANLHFARLKQLAEEGHAIPLRTLLTTTPGDLAGRPQADRDALYAASFVLVEFLLEKGDLRKLIDFGRTAQAEGPDAAARKLYGHASLAELERAWTTFALY